MAEASRHDAWQASESYDLYMGRWSRQIALRFLDWLNLPSGLDWLEAGCGTGALSAAIVSGCDPECLTAIDLSEAFLAKARASVQDSRATFLCGDMQALSVETARYDVAVSALVLNFVPDKVKALREMKRVVKPGGTVGFYVWDYPGGGVEFIRAFWTAATALDPQARDLTEGNRFAFCTPESLTALAREAGLTPVLCIAIEEPTVFASFDDYWHPFTLGAGPAPGYCVKLDPAARQRLKDTLSDSLTRQPNGSIALKSRAWAIKAVVA